MEIIELGPKSAQLISKSIEECVSTRFFVFKHWFRSKKVFVGVIVHCGKVPASTWISSS